MQAILRRQRAGEQLPVADERRRENLREAGNTVGQQNSVDAILNVAMLVADVKIALARRVLVDAWELQNQVTELNGVCLRDVLDVPLRQFRCSGANFRHEGCVAALIEGL